MRYSILLLILSIVFSACNQPEIGAIDNEALARKLFAAVKENDFEKSEQLFPDKGTYRKIIKEWKQIDVAEAAYDSLVTSAETNFESVVQMLPDWSESKYMNTQAEMNKYGSLQFAAITTKFESKGEHYKFSCTTCKYNGKWFYMGDMSWVPK